MDISRLLHIVGIKPIRALLVLVVVFNVPAVDARIDELLLEIRPEPGVVVRVVRQPNWDVVLRQPFGDNIVLPRPSKRKLGMPLPELRQIDIDFDGHPDLAVHFPEAKSDDPLQIVRYVPTERRYETLHVPSSPKTLCNWRSAVPDPEREVLTLSCRQGLAQLTETIRFNAFGMAWLDTRLIEDHRSVPNAYPYIPMARQFSRWDETGQELEIDARDRDGHPIYLTIPVPRTSVYAQPGQEAQDNDTLRRGDRVRLLDWMPDWLRVSWKGETGTLDRWIWIPGAFDLAAQIDVAAASGNADFALSTGGQLADKVTSSFGDLFPISVTNKGVHPRTLDRPELHLLFYDRDGWHFWTQSLLSRKSVTVHPGERVVLETGPLYIEYGSYTLAHPMPDEFDSEIMLFPFDLSPGTYSVRVALTSLRLGAPIFSDEQSFCHSPVQVSAESCQLEERPEF